MRSSWAHAALLAVFVLGGNVSRIFAQEAPWIVFPDPESEAACDVVNAGNLEFVVLRDTGALFVVTEEDYPLDEAAFVRDGVFFYLEIPVGAIFFADDGNGFRTAWLLAIDDTVLELDPDTGGPIFTDLFPDDFEGVPCAAFDLWDDDDFDEVPDDFDDCPLDFGDDPSGCPCEELDDDLDGVTNCFDQCPNTPLNTFVTDDGCPCELFDEDGCVTVIVVEPPPITVVQPPPITIVCGNFSTLTMALTFGTLITMRLARRRGS